MKNLSKKFDSLCALSAFIANNAPAGYFAGRKLASTDGDADFCGTPDFEAADNMMLGGWSDGAKRVEAAMIKSSAAMSDRPRCHTSTVGFAPNVPNYLAGSPLNMINKKRVHVPARVVDIVYNCAVGCSVSASDIEVAAAKLFNVVAGLESAGMRVNLWVVNVNVSNDQNASIAVKIKSDSQPLNVLKMIYPAAHPSFLRRHLFAVLERAGVTGHEWWGYGKVIKDSAKIKEVVRGFRLSDKNIFSYYNLYSKTEKEISDMIK